MIYAVELSEQADSDLRGIFEYIVLKAVFRLIDCFYSVQF